jgi:hypothetical protein
VAAGEAQAATDEQTPPLALPSLDQRKRQSKKKKGPLAMASGPSLGRKRPRRAAIARGATAPQQYATAPHKAQVFSGDFPCKKRMSEHRPRRGTAEII